jgi:Leucine-rich repeat (LRR) protein
LPTLKHLFLDSLPEDGAGMEALASLSQLESLHLDKLPLPAGSLAHIAGLTKLETLILEDSGIDDDNLAHIAGLTALKHLDLEGCDITDAGLEQIRELRKLERLSLEDCPITGSGFTNFANLSQLMFLSLEGVRLKIGLEHIGVLVHLAGLPNLKNLDLQDKDGVSDDGLRILAKSASLSRLEVGNTQVTAVAVRLLPNVRVKWQEPEERLPREHQEEARIAAIPKALSFRLQDNALVLLNAENDVEFARKTPADLFWG